MIYMIYMIYLIAMILKNQGNQDNHKNQGSDDSRKYENDILLPVFWKSIHPACYGRHPSRGEL